jgi:hypothetical protein
VVNIFVKNMEKETEKQENNGEVLLKTTVTRTELREIYRKTGNPFYEDEEGIWLYGDDDFSHRGLGTVFVRSPKD